MRSDAAREEEARAHVDRTVVRRDEDARGRRPRPSAQVPEIPLVEQLYEDLVAYSRELSCHRTDVTNAELRMCEAARQHADHMLEIKTAGQSLSTRIREAYVRRSADSMSEKRELDACRQELDDMYADVVATEAESELAEALSASTRRDLEEAGALAVVVKETGERRALLCAKHDALEAEAKILRHELQENKGSLELCNRRVQGLRNDLATKEQSVITYGERAQELRLELAQLLLGLRKSYEGSRHERETLAARIATLEGRRV
eukprot:CAMPEP_0194547210 /NCGR_PEP_ID=MMETSP0253-20130528/91812_1 /TAXON_ID=2966 /ORGANISM="Noctiluca scintillans" /LENGTH=262 /DNA_ID=CAMNT_0039394391 /DNA_START=145 /DNA_END=933 /DNA_ORIENTATION=+